MRIVFDSGTSALGTSFASFQNVLAAGDPSAIGGAGAVYLFRRTSSGWSLENTLDGNTYGLSGDFGRALSWNSMLLLVGAPASNQGTGVLGLFTFDSSLSQVCD